MPRILPYLWKVSTDQEKRVSDTVMKVLEGFISKVEEASNNPSLGKMIGKQESFVDVWWW